MKCFNKITILLLLIISLCGCDDVYYYSSVPISNIKHSYIDSSLIGYWEHSGHEYGGFDIYMKILPINDKELIIDYLLMGEELVIPYEEMWYTFIGHTTKIDTCYYYNLKNLDNALERNKNLYCFFTVTLEGDSLHTNFLNKDFEMEPKSSREFKKYILNNQKEFNSLFVNEYSFTKLRNNLDDLEREDARKK